MHSEEHGSWRQLRDAGRTSVEIKMTKVGFARCDPELRMDAHAPRGSATTYDRSISAEPLVCQTSLASLVNMRARGSFRAAHEDTDSTRADVMMCIHRAGGSALTACETCWGRWGEAIYTAAIRAHGVRCRLMGLVECHLLCNETPQLTRGTELEARGAIATIRWQALGPSRIANLGEARMAITMGASHHRGGKHVDGLRV